MRYCPYVVVVQDTSLAYGWASGYPKKLGSVWVTRSMGVTSTASPGLQSGGIFAGTVAVKHRRLAEGHVELKTLAADSAVTFGSRPIVALRHFPSLFEGQLDRPAGFELVRLQAENVQAGPVWEGAADLTVFDSPLELLSMLRPVRVGRGWRCSLAMTNRVNHLLHDLRGMAPHSHPEEN